MEPSIRSAFASPAFTPTFPSPVIPGSSLGRGGLGRGYSGRPRSGITSRIARRHRPISSEDGGIIFRGLGLQRLRPLHEHDMQPAWTMRPELNALLDIAGARRAGDQIDRARPGLRVAARLGAHPVPGVLVSGDDLPGAQDDDMR